MTGTPGAQLVSTEWEGPMAARGASLALFLVLYAFPAFGCSCANPAPIQASLKHYQDRAVFGARVIQLLGPVYHLHGTRAAERALAIVHRRYWGLPWYWPAIVLLNGSGQCDIPMTDGEEYLVSGWPERYGVLEVNGCSRTQPLASAQLDLLTLDGSHCSAPGGTIVGRITHEGTPVGGATVTYRDGSGRPYTTRSDQDGIYELRHLPAGEYRFDPQYASGRYVAGDASVVEGVCGESPVVAE